MVVLTTLGRMIYEEEYRPQFGALVQPVIAALRLLEADIWRIAGKVYGDVSPKAWTRIYAANKHIIGPNQSRLQIGTQLTIPAP